MSYQLALTEDQRLVVLRALVDADGSANESIIHHCLDVYGHRISRDTVRTHMTWLEEQGLIRINDVAGCYVAELTGRGQDVVEARAKVPGIKTPRAR